MQKKTTYILIDSSGSMRGGRSDAVNNAMKEVIEEIIPQVMNQKDAELKPYLAVLAFRTDERDIKKLKLDWIIPRTEMEQVSEWVNMERECFSGGTPTGEAIGEIVKDINSGCYGDMDPDAVPPAILLLSDGMPNGEILPYEEALKFSDKNSEHYCSDYAHANRIAIGIQVEEEGKESLMKFGKLSKSLSQKNFQAYYDVTDDRRDVLIELIKNCVFTLSIE